MARAGRRPARWPIAVAAGAVLAVSLAPAASADSLTYRNDRFGVEVTFPADLFDGQEPPPANGDGMTFTAGDGGSLAAYGGFNVDGLGPRAYLDQQIGWMPQGTAVTYQRVGAGWAVVSGTQGDTIFYQRFEFDHDVVRAVLLRYPRSARAKYDPAVGPIANSLRGP